jgi:hypothetical protein
VTVKVGIVGTRTRDTLQDYDRIKVAFFCLRDKLGAHTDDFHIISGGCRMGADRFAERMAEDCQMTITIYYPKWNRLGRRAGAIRNKQIAEESDYLIACVSPDRKGGTEITIKEFLKLKNKDKLIIV